MQQPRFAFVHHTPHTLLPRRHAHQLSHKQVRRVRPCTPRRSQATKASTPSDMPPNPQDGPPGASRHNRTEQTGPRATSKTLVGKILVEMFSFLFGAILLLVVVLWRFSQFLAVRLLRALTFLSQMRRLGRWAFGRVLPVARIAMPVASLAHAVGRGVRLAFGRDAADFEVDSVGGRARSVSVAPGSDGQHVPHATVDVYEGNDGFENSPKRARTGRRLILMRDAKARWDRDGQAPDHDRELSARGIAEARIIGRELTKLDWVPDVVVCSDAVRAIQTLDEMSLPAGEGMSILQTEALYYAVTGDDMAMAVDDLLGSVGFCDGSTVMVLCHNPGCEELCELVSGERPDLGTACTVLLKHMQTREAFSWRASPDLKLAAQEANWSIHQLLRP